ncbi:MAG: hypothetical protein BWY73_00473 [candidate division TA06 bacterium ADurb.Bin417]|uniref:Tetratricopeptide repeat protein n=1 Tax=candidate division TA06 bacterium ADurb.Bin417 TaxID=1852828 RepID=A0A1V5MJY3_UNCT6|nr:MAG: hypothetical protein BWY73_00473 [candidate division TA06 bacterium ADurb.Bin417]
MKLLKLALAGLVGFLLLCGPHPASGADSRDPAIAAGQAALKQGMEAAKRKNWPLAVKRYTEAQKRIHLSPQIMHNLALAHAQMGNELLADVWFRAYLGAVPQAANADEVRAEIARLEKAADDKVQLLFKQAEDLAELLPVQGKDKWDIGRRAEAFQEIASEKVEVGDFKGADEDLLKAKQCRAAEVAGFYGYLEYLESKNARFAETLAEIGDVEGASFIHDKMKDTGRRKSLEAKILEGAVRLGDLDQVKRLLDKQYLPEYDLGYIEISLAFAKKDDIETARAVAKKEPVAGVRLAEYLLSRGRISEAVEIAASAGDRIRAMIIRGEVEKAFQRLLAGAGDENSRLTPEYIFKILSDIIKDSVYLGDSRTTQRADQLVREFFKNGAPTAEPGQKYFPAREKKNGYVNEMIAVGKAYLVVENGTTNDAVKLIKTQIHTFEGRRDLCDFAIRRNKLAAAERIADSFAESRERIEFLRQVLAAYESKNDRANAERLTKKLAGLLADVQLGWDPENPGREFVVNAWTDAAYEFSPYSVFSDLQAEIADCKKDRDSEDIPWCVAMTGRFIGKGLIKIRFLDRIYR